MPYRFFFAWRQGCSVFIWYDDRRHKSTHNAACRIEDIKVGSKVIEYGLLVRECSTTNELSRDVTKSGVSSLEVT
jgi:hypothetical protein